MRTASILGPTFALLLVACGGSDSSGLVKDDGSSSGASSGGSSDAGGGLTPSGSSSGSSGGSSSSGGSGSGSGSGSSSGGTGSSSGGSSSGGSSGGDDGGAFVPATHPTFPQLVNNGGSVLKSPSVQPVFFANYDLTKEVGAMLATLPTAKLSNGDTFWSAAVGEYGVGALTMLPPIVLTDTAPTSDTDPGSFLQSKLSDPAFKSVTSSTILAIFYPSTTPLSGSCAATTPGYGGYHESFSNNGSPQPYAVMTECAKFGPITRALDMVTVAASHEIIEAVTDPYPDSDEAYSGLDSTDYGFTMNAFLEGNAENGDLCTINNGFGRGDASYPYLLQRGWSNAAAKAGIDPCSPDLRPGQPYVGAFPVLPDKVTIGHGDSGPGVKIAVGSSATIEVDLFSLEPTADFTVSARQSSQVDPPTLQFSWDKTTGHNGDKLHLTIEAVSDGGQGFETFIVQSALPGAAASDTQKAAWAGVVTH